MIAPGALPYRIGTYATFWSAMSARVRTLLPGLTTRALDDPSVALLDAWAILADVLTFYQERIANEGFVATATERRSLTALAELTGYAPRPGVAAAAYFAYTLDPGATVTLPPGSKAQSVPGPGESPQTFETSAALEARATWNALRLRATRPQIPTGSAPFFLAPTTGVRPNDLLLFVRAAATAGGIPEHRFARVGSVEPQPADGRSKITLQGEGWSWDTPPALSEAPVAQPASRPADLLARIGAIETPLLRGGSVPPRTPQRLHRSDSQTYGANLDVVAQLFGALHPAARGTVLGAIATPPAPSSPPVAVYAFRVHAAPYGHNAPPLGALRAAALEEVDREDRDWPLADADRRYPAQLSFDARYERVGAGSFVAIRDFDDASPALYEVTDVRERSRHDYGLSATTTVVRLDRPYLAGGREATLESLRRLEVFAQSERLTLVDEPIADDVPAPAAPTLLELDGIYEGLAAGRWVIVTGTRTDLPGVAGAELAMIAATEHRTDPAIADDRVHTFVTLAAPLAFTYARPSVTVWGNVVPATQGETTTQTLGSGDASQARQSFALRAKPLTFVASPTQSGTRSALTIVVDGVTWTETSEINACGPTDRVFTTATTADGTTVTFGDGLHGVRLPTGSENVVATYRVGLGNAGNVGGAKIALLQSRPLGVKAVVNPLPAAGGADPEPPDEIRRNLATALLALGRLVALTDYGDFARSFAGVAKAEAARVGTGPDATLAITLAGPRNAPIDLRGDLATNLALALRALGDPRQPFVLAACARVVLLVGATLVLEPGARWETVEAAARAALLARFSFDARGFGQAAFASEAISALADVAGVAAVTLQTFVGITAETLAQLPALGRGRVVRPVIAPLAARRVAGGIVGAQLVAIDASVPDTIVLRLGAEDAR